MRHYILALLLLLGGSSSLRAQSTLQWQRRIGVRAANNAETTRATIYTSKNRVVSVGYKQVSNSTTSALWMLSSRGDSLRTVFYPYTTLAGDIAEYSLYAVAEMSDGDLLMVGMLGRLTSPTTSVSDLALLRTDSLGTLRWVRLYPSADVLNIFAVQAVPDGGALVVVTTQHPQGTINTPVSLPTVIRVDAAGNHLWHRTYGQPYYTLRSITPLSDGSYALAGNTLSGPPQWSGGAWVLRLTLHGDTLRSRVVVPTATFAAMSEAPGGGLVLAGHDITGGLVVYTDSLDRLQWRHSIAPQRPNTSSYFTFVRAAAQAGRVLVVGLRPVTQSTSPATYVDDYVALWQAPATAGGTASTVWAQQLNLGNITRSRVALGAANTLVAGAGYYDVTNRQYDLRFSRLANIPALYQPPLCRTPPQANAAFAIPAAAPDSLNLLELGTAGPTYAQVVRWRWTLGDGTVVVRTSPGWVRHQYATVPAPGTAVTVTITNNLGCTSTQVLYPFGQPTATQQARALQAGASLFPNPASSTVTVRLPGLRPQPEVDGELLNSVGQRVQGLRLPVAALERGAAVEIIDLPAGVYTLRLRPLEGAVVKRLVKQ